VSVYRCSDLTRHKTFIQQSSTYAHMMHLSVCLSVCLSVRLTIRWLENYSTYLHSVCLLHRLETNLRLLCTFTGQGHVPEGSRLWTILSRVAIFIFCWYFYGWYYQHHRRHHHHHHQRVNQPNSLSYEHPCLSDTYR